MTLKLAFLVFLSLAIISQAAVAEGPPPAPGYGSNEELTSAIGSGGLTPMKFAPDLPENVVEKKDVVYGQGGGHDLELDLYSPKGLDKAVPGIVLIHGGGWRGGRRQDYRYYAMHFAERGYVAATITYRFSQEAPFPACVHDAKCAVRWMRANAEELHVDPDRIAALGGSAGAHLAMMLAYARDVPELEGDGGHEGVSSAVQAVINIYGPTYFLPPFANMDLVQYLMGDKPYAEQPVEYAKASPLNYVSPYDPPTLILHGTLDLTVPIDHADKLAAKLHDMGVPYHYDRLDGWGHGMDIFDAPNRRGLWQMDRFLEKYLPVEE